MTLQMIPANSLDLKRILYRFTYLMQVIGDTSRLFLFFFFGHLPNEAERYLLDAYYPPKFRFNYVAIKQVNHTINVLLSSVILDGKICVASCLGSRESFHSRFDILA